MISKTFKAFFFLLSKKAESPSSLESIYHKEWPENASIVTNENKELSNPNNSLNVNDHSQKFRHYF